MNKHLKLRGFICVKVLEFLSIDDASDDFRLREINLRGYFVGFLYLISGRNQYVAPSGNAAFRAYLDIIEKYAKSTKHINRLQTAFQELLFKNDYEFSLVGYGDQILDHAADALVREARRMGSFRHFFKVKDVMSSAFFRTLLRCRKALIFIVRMVQHHALASAVGTIVLGLIVAYLSHKLGWA